MADQAVALDDITIVLVDDHQILTDALQTMLGSVPGFQVLGTADSCDGCRQLLALNCPRVLVLDVSLPDGDGIQLVPELRRLCPRTAILVMTSLSDEQTLQRAVSVGVNGFMPKRQPLAGLTDAIRRAAEGEIVIPASLLLGLLSQTPHRRRGTSSLTPREREILQMLARGKSGPDIAKALNIALPTVRTHIGNIMSKLGVHSRLEAVTHALRRGMIDPP